MTGQTANERARIGPCHRVSIVTCHIAEGCNLDCAYCRNRGVRPPVMSMEMDTLARAAAWVARRTRRNKVTWVLFGGEPLLRPVAWISDAVTRVRAEFAGNRIEAGISVQTNGTLLTDAVADMMLSLQVRPCISVDGPPEIHDLARRDGQRTWEGIRRLLDRGIVPRIVCVLGPHNHARLRDVITAFMNRGLKAVRINFLCPPRDAGDPQTLTGDQMFHARRLILQHMLRDPDRFREANMARLMRLYVHPGSQRPDNMRGCAAPVCGAGITHISISAGGDIFLCDRATNREPACRIGSVNHPEDDGHWRESVRSFHMVHRLPPHCERCESRRFCLHSCTLYRRGPHHERDLCRSTRLLARWLDAHNNAIEDWVRRFDQTTA